MARCLALVLCLNLIYCCTGESEELSRSKEMNSTILQNSPRFVVKLPDKNLLCFSFEGYEFFTYNLITSNYLVLNGYLSLASISGGDDEEEEEEDVDDVEGSKVRGFRDLGVIIKVVDKRIKGGKRVFKHQLYGEKKKVFLEKFGEVDIKKGAITFSISEGRSNIESRGSPYEEFRIMGDAPKFDIVALSTNGHTFNIYVEGDAGLIGIDSHGLIDHSFAEQKEGLVTLAQFPLQLGQFYHSKVRVSLAYQELHLMNGKVVPVEEGLVWDDIVDPAYAGKACWHPVDGESVIEGNPWDYVVEHINSPAYKYSLYKK